MEMDALADPPGGEILEATNRGTPPIKIILSRVPVDVNHSNGLDAQIRLTYQLISS